MWLYRKVERYNHKKTEVKTSVFLLVTSEGFKPSTSTAVMWCTIQLCYEAKTFANIKNTVVK